MKKVLIQPHTSSSFTLHLQLQYYCFHLVFPALAFTSLSFTKSSINSQLKKCLKSGTTFSASVQNHSGSKMK
ncbi:hypothetical protein EXN66_Car006390 [Channa argus]|uniref:Uncharacterized protein n=1 Tax=Channa argus TaxID=215402 RepID=A0A6G1PKF8_CHAAH|nr:hypothetical protein EXN66_Car006390 [Channa argus]